MFGTSNISGRDAQKLVEKNRTETRYVGGVPGVGGAIDPQWSNEPEPVASGLAAH